METTTRPQQLSLSFHTSVEAVSVPPAAVAENSVASAAVIYDFKSAAAKREASAQAALYRQILDSVRHIG